MVSLSILARLCSILGMKKRYIVNLTADERESLAQIVGRERVSGLKRMRASILLKADEGLTDEEIAHDLDIGVVTVERVRKRCMERGVEGALERRPQENPSRPRKLDGASEAQLVRLACSEPPDGNTRWTLSLLAGKLVELKIFDSVSKSTVQRGLKKRAQALAGKALLHPARKERGLRAGDGGCFGGLPSTLRWISTADMPR